MRELYLPMKHSDHLPCSDAYDEPKYPRTQDGATSPLRGIREKPGESSICARLGREEPRFAERPARPGDTVVIPARERHESDALAGGVDHPAVPERDAGVVDLRGAR